MSLREQMAGNKYWETDVTKEQISENRCLGNKGLGNKCHAALIPLVI